MKTCRKGHEYQNDRRQCPVCQAFNNRQRYKRDREKRIRAAVEYYKTHKDKKREQYLRYKEKYPERIVPWDWKQFKEDHPLHSIWSGMKTRCYNQKSPEYPNYGGRGITVCDEWRHRGGYKRFEADMSPRPSLMHTLDRIDNDKGYSKENCKWSTPREQGANQRSNRLVTINGKTQTLQQWARESGISSTGFGYRIKRGWPESRLLEPVNRKNRSRLGIERKLIEAVLQMHKALGDSKYEGKEDIEQLLKELDLFSVATEAA